MKEKQILIGRQVPRYRRVNKKTKTKILDGFVEAAGYNRKYAPHILTHWRKNPSRRGRHTRQTQGASPGGNDF
jgi:hypothetical protein